MPRHGLLRFARNDGGELRQNNPTGKSLPIYGNRVKSHEIKNISAFTAGKSGLHLRPSRPTQRASAVVTDVGRVAVDAGLRLDDGADGAYGKDRVVLTPVAGVKLSEKRKLNQAATESTRTRLRGEHGISRKAIAQGRPGVLRCPVCSCAAFLVQTAHGTAGAARTRSSLRPLFERAGSFQQSSGAMRRENANSYSVSSPGLTGRPSIPETSMIEPRSRGVLGPPLSRRTTDGVRRVISHHLTTSPIFLLRLLDQLLAHDHLPSRHDEDHRRGAGDRDREDRSRQRQRRGGMAAEIGAELRHQRADPHLQKSHRAGCGAGGFGADAERAGGRVRHHEGVGDHHDHLGAEQDGRRLVGPRKTPYQIEQAAAELQRQPEPDQLLQRWRGAKRTQKRLPTR